MKNHNLDVLIDKYLRGTATEEERVCLHEWYRSQEEGDIIWEMKDEQEEQAIRARLRENIWAEAQIGATRSVLKWRKWIPIAAAVLLVALASIWWSKEANRIDNTENLIAATPQEQVESRFVLLPDSTRVLLRPGSTLEYRSDFSGDTREVALEGEGYFDVSHRPDQPFIIHTGKVRTVVLGTAFTIKSSADQKDVSVIVQRGKVRVERENGVLAELIANQKIEIHAESTPQKQQNITPEESFSWTGEDLRFDNMAFGELTKRLQRRYDVQIKFVNEDLANCPVSGRFVGTESLEEVLDILCTTRNATYKETETKEILIQGKACM
jgi:transmembrane sensor